MRLSFFYVTSGVLIALLSGSAHADQKFKQKVSYELRGLAPADSGVSKLGWLVGLRSVRYVGDSRLHWGVNLGIGNPTGTGTDRFLYGTLLLGADFLLGKKVVLDLSLGAGYATADYNVGNAQEGLAIEPSVALGFIVGGGWRVAPMASYLQVPGVEGVRGFGFGLRIDYKTLTTIKELDD